MKGHSDLLRDDALDSGTSYRVWIVVDRRAAGIEARHRNDEGGYAEWRSEGWRLILYGQG